VTSALRLAVPAAFVVAGALYLLLRTRDPAADEPPEPVAGEATSPGKPRPAITTGTLLLRVRTSDGRPLPKDAHAGYVVGREPRLREVSSEGVVRFSDVALVPDAAQTRIEAVAKAPGYLSARAEILVAPNVPAEALLTLTPMP
jgi:hypothetical protein